MATKNSIAAAAATSGLFEKPTEPAENKQTEATETEKTAAVEEKAAVGVEKKKPGPKKGSTRKKTAAKSTTRTKKPTTRTKKPVETEKKPTKPEQPQEKSESKEKAIFSCRMDADLVARWKAYAKVEKYGDIGKMTADIISEYMNTHKLTGESKKRFDTLYEASKL